MFVQRIGRLDKTRFGINFKVEDIKCNFFKINKNLLKKDNVNKNNGEK